MRRERSAVCLQCGATFTKTSRFTGAMKFCSARCSNQRTNENRKNTAAQFWAQVAIGAPEDCWPWTGLLHPTGYGVASFQGKQQKAHRIALALTDGNWDSPLYACHSCDNKPCCNPAHLRRGTHRDNMQDASKRGRFRSAKGEANRRAKLTPTQVLAIRSSGDPTATLAGAFGVCIGTIQQIRNRSTWRHLP